MTKLPSGQEVLLLKPPDDTVALDASHFLVSSHAAVMEVLWTHGNYGPLSIREIRAYLHDEEYGKGLLSTSTVNVFVNQLVKKGFVRRSAHHNKRRTKYYRFAAVVSEESLILKHITKVLEVLVYLNPDIVEQEVDRILGALKYRRPSTIHAGLYGEKRDPFREIAPEEDES